MPNLAYDAMSRLNDGDHIGSWTHTPVGVPRGVFVLGAYPNGATDRVSGITYGGVSMSRIQMQRRTSGAQKAAFLYFLGSSIPTGAQTVVVSGTSDSGGESVCLSFVANGNTEIVDSDGGTGNVTDLSRLLSTSGYECIAVANCVPQNNTNWTPTSGQSLMHEGSQTNGYRRFYRQTTASTSDFDAGGNLSAAQNAAFCMANIRDLQPRLPTSRSAVIG